tara:strand:+ start:1922 stop:2197 length:276 start_codon:yes stop_codon:yes gene_type:complete
VSYTSIEYGKAQGSRFGALIFESGLLVPRSERAKPLFERGQHVSNNYNNMTREDQAVVSRVSGYKPGRKIQEEIRIEQRKEIQAKTWELFT